LYINGCKKKIYAIYIYTHKHTHIYVHHIQAAQQKIMERNDRLSVGLMNQRLLVQPFQDQGELCHDILN
jgi:hypothetical protein